MALETLLNEESLLESDLEGVCEMAEEIKEVPTPGSLKREYPIKGVAAENVEYSRREIKEILEGNSDRFLVIAGPCSIDDERAAGEYAQKLKKLSEEVNDEIKLVMRVYLEKPRTTVGWKGILYDPERDDSLDIGKGLRKSRKILKDINEMGVATATELLSPMAKNYLGDCLSYVAIGARTTESQVHREFASALDMPVGFKNTTGGDFKKAVQSIISSSSPHTYIGNSEDGRISIVSSKGNSYSHLILRGGSDGANYQKEKVDKATGLLEENGLKKAIIVDCSHANSGKRYEMQAQVARDVLKQREENPAIKGIMLESYLKEGKGDEYGQSKTDACMGWDETKELVRELDSYILRKENV